MAMNDAQAESAAKELILALAQSESLKLRGSAAVQSPESGANVGERDAAYITSLYRNLVSGFQK